MYTEYYTLRTGKATEQTIYPEKFTSYEAAFDKMVKEYLRTQKASYDHPSGQPIRYGIWKTTEYDNNSMTQAVWS